jgi:hypothetical protein
MAPSASASASARSDPPAPRPDVIPNRTIIGNRGSGKSVSLERMMTEVAREASVLLIDWPGTLADRMAARMIEDGQEHRIVVDKALWTDRMPRWPFWAEPSADDPLRRAIEEEAAIEGLLAACFGRRYQKDGTLVPNTHRAAEAALAAYFGIPQERRPPLDRLACLFRARDPVGGWMLEATAGREAAAFLLDARKTALRSPQQWDYLVGPGGRLLSVLSSPAVWPRSGHSLDWRELIRARRHFYLGMEGLPATVAASLAVLTYAPALEAARRLFEETGESHPLVVVLEEAGALGLVTPVVLTAMQAYRKHGVAVWVASQTVEDFRDEATLEALLAMSEHHWHQMASGVERAARDCAGPTYDPDRVLHERRRPVVTGHASVATETTRLDREGRITGWTHGRTLRPVLGTEVIREYENPANHEAELRKELSTLRVGERIVREVDGTVRRESLPLHEDPFGPFADEIITRDGVTRPLGWHRLHTAYDRIRSSPVYLPPPVWTPPSPARSAPTPTPTPPTAGVPSGMHGS